MVVASVRIPGRRLAVLSDSNGNALSVTATGQGAHNPCDISLRAKLLPSRPATESTPSIVTARSRARTMMRWNGRYAPLTLLLQTGGFSAIVLDLASIAPELFPVSNSPRGIGIELQPSAHRAFFCFRSIRAPRADPNCNCAYQRHQRWNRRATVFTGIESAVDVERQRFRKTEPAMLFRCAKPPQSAHGACWDNRMDWAGP